MKKFLYLTSLLLMTACATENNKIPENEEGTQMTGIVTLSSEQVQAIKLQFGKIGKRNLSNVVKANGYLDVPPQNKAVISPMITGYVRKVNYLLGDDVKKGQVMAELESMEYIDLQQQYMELKSNLSYLKEDFERQKLLREQDAVSMKKYLKAEMDLNVVNSTLESVTSKLQLLGNDLGQLDQGIIQSKILLRAPFTGSVNKLNVQIGKHVDPHEEIYELINTDHLHFEMSVYEKDIPKVRKGQKVLFRLPSLGNRELEGEVFLVGKDLSEEKRSINVHVHFNDDQDDFTVGMYGTAAIAIDLNAMQVVPSKSVVVDGTEKFIFRVSTKENNQYGFEKVQVQTGLESDGYVQLIDANSISESDQIVTEGAFYLLNAFLGTAGE